MDSTRLAGVVVAALALVGYVVGVVAPYPGRSITLTGLMVGLTLAAVGGRGDGSGDGGGDASGTGDASGGDGR
jgi:hypothetical protein